MTNLMKHMKFMKRMGGEVSFVDLRVAGDFK